MKTVTAITPTIQIDFGSFYAAAAVTTCTGYHIIVELYDNGTADMFCNNVYSNTSKRSEPIWYGDVLSWMSATQPGCFDFLDPVKVGDLAQKIAPLLGKVHAGCTVYRDKEGNPTGRLNQSGEDASQMIHQLLAEELNLGTDEYSFERVMSLFEQVDTEGIKIADSVLDGIFEQYPDMKTFIDIADYLDMDETDTLNDLMETYQITTGEHFDLAYAILMEAKHEQLSLITGGIDAVMHHLYKLDSATRGQKPD
ncbi:MAG: hypothetical protein ACR2P9_02310 [Gammaproteobacteria bacterium]